MRKRLRNDVRSSIEATGHAVMMEKIAGWPEKYYWQAVWWRLHSKESKNKSECIRYSRNLIKLMHDIRFRKNYYLCKPKDVSDWQQYLKLNK